MITLSILREETLRNYVGFQNVYFLPHQQLFGLVWPKLCLFTEGSTLENMVIFLKLIQFSKNEVFIIQSDVYYALELSSHFFKTDVTVSNCMHFHFMSRPSNATTNKQATSSLLARQVFQQRQDTLQMEGKLASGLFSSFLYNYSAKKIQF